METVSIFYINLDSRKDRRDAMEERFKLFGLKVTRKSAVTPDKLNIPFHPSAQNLNKGEKSCAQSHVEIMKDFLKSEEEVLMILEDDMKFRKDMVDIINQKLENIDKEDPDWNCLFLYTTEGIKHYSQSNAGIPMNEEDKKMMNLWRPIQEHYSSAAMIFSRKGVMELFSMFNDYTGYHKSDWMTWCLQTRGPCYGIFPWIACIDGSESCLIVHSDTEGGDPDFLKAMKLLKEVDYSYDNYE
jgi:GR25 family glycosyltransferase involved in LPS biosynthesis